MKQNDKNLRDLKKIFKDQNNNIFPTTKANNKKTIFIILFILVFFLIIIFYINKSKLLKPNNNQLKNIEIQGYKLNQPFKYNIYEYYVEVEEDKIQLICETEGTVDGCNKTISLENKEIYKHKLILKNDKKIIEYTIVITKKLEETQLRIDSIEGNPLTWTNKNITIKVNSISSHEISEYSFDDGKTWQKNNELLVEENKTLNVILKDTKGNTTIPKEIIIDKIDKKIPTVKILKGDISKEQIVLNVIATDELSGIKEINFNNKIYQNKNSFIITKPGIYTVTVTDNADNKSKEEKIIITEDDFKKDEEIPQKKFTAIFDDNLKNKQTKINCQTNGDSCEITTPEIIKEGYEILGWSTNKNDTSATYKVNEKIILLQDTTYYAITKKDFKLTLNNNDNIETSPNIKICSIYNNENFCKITLPNISRDGYTMLGWSTNKNDTSATYKVNDEFKLDKDYTLYTITKKDLTITLDNNGATYIAKKQESCTIYNTEKSCKITLPDISRDEYTILGWSTNKNDTTETYKVNEKIILLQDTTYYAITKKDLKLTLNNNDNTEAFPNIKTCSIYNNETSCKITLPDISRDGYTMLGWSTNKDDTSATYKVNDEFTLNKNTTLYAITKKEIKLTLNLNNNTNPWTNIKLCTLYNDQSSCKITLPYISRDEYTMLGWSTNKDDTSATYKVNDEFTLNKNTTLYAITKKNITVSLNHNGATSVGSPKENCNIYNTQEKCEVTLPSISRDGYTILGWSTDKDDTTGVYKVKDKFELTKNTTLYAITKKTFTITLNKNGATSIKEDKQICDIYNNQTSCTIKLLNIVRDGYEILGWSDNKDATTEVYKVNDEFTLTKNTTLYAITKKILTLTLDKNGATSVGSQKLTCNIYNQNTYCSMSLPTITRNGYSIIGWSLNKNNTTAEKKVYERIDLSNDQTLYAITKKDITLTFNTNGATSIGANTKKCTIYNSQTGCNIVFPSITRNGYSIIGWSTNKDATTKNYSANETAAISENYNFYAITKKTLYLYFDMNVTARSCNIYNNQTSCSITLPSFTKPGSFNGAWDDQKNNPEPTYIAGTQFILTENKQLYGSIYNPFNYNYFKYNIFAERPNYTKVRQITIQKSVHLRNTTFDYQIGIPTTAVNNHITLLNKINNELPFLLVPGKVFIMSYSEYEYYSDYYGVTYPLNSYMFIDLKYDSAGVVVKNAIDENATLHELAHAWDHYYNFKTNKGRICEQSDFMEFYNNISSKTHINSDGSKLSNVEMFAAMLTNYYWHILGNNPNLSSYYGLKSGAKLSENEKTQIKNILEKYIRISNNNYKV